MALCNFVARIVADEVRDDGAERVRRFKIEGQLDDGTVLPAAAVSAVQFAAMNWIVGEWGTRAVLFAGQGTKDHVRTALQLLSGKPHERTVYGHLGWRKLSGEWNYLHAGGAIGAGGPVPGVDVELGGGRLRDFALPNPPEGEGLRKAVRTSLALLKVAPLRVSVPLLAAVYRAPLGGALAVDFSLHVAGTTGANKTSLASVAQAHYGAELADGGPPAGWASTDNALEALAFAAKDAVLLVDDFAPTGSQADIQRMNGKADRVLRAQGNRSGRSRMNADGSLRPDRPPRGLVLSTGEDVPMGHSLRARALILELAPGDVDLVELTTAQASARGGWFALAMAAYVRWLAPQIDALHERLPQRHRELRVTLRTVLTRHPRTPDLAASLLLGLETLLRFAQETGALNQAEAADMETQGTAALIEAGRYQAGHQASEEPTGRFLNLLAAALSSGAAHLASCETGERPVDPEFWGWRRATVAGEWNAQGPHIGWIGPGDEILLEPEASFAAVQLLANRQGAPVAVSQRTLWKRLAERGLLIRGDHDHLTQKRSVSGTRHRVIVLPMAVLSPGTGATGADGPEPRQEQLCTAPVVVQTCGQPGQEPGQPVGPTCGHSRQSVPAAPVTGVS